MDSKSDIPKHESRHLRYVKQLRKLYDEATDGTIKQKYRREQHILRDWLFKDKNYEKCAICGKSFKIDALVAAHKKKRKCCNNAERLDPYIVMPLCVFGCDYLYENGYVYIKDGIVCRGHMVTGKTFEDEYIEHIVGKLLAKKWNRGSNQYFNNQELKNENTRSQSF